MLRKLALVGLVLLAGRGSAAQLNVALLLSFGSFALQVKAWPYKFSQDNVVRAVRLISFMATVLLHPLLLFGVILT